MFKIGEIYRSKKDDLGDKDIVDGYKNYYYEVKTNDFGFAFERGIHVSKKVKCDDGTERIPVIIVSSSPHKSGTANTPWCDFYDPDHGYILYYGDNKPGKSKPHEASGNKALLELKQYYDSNIKEDRLNKTVPIVFFERVGKGLLKFQGFGIIDSVELVTQYHKKDGYFSNYRFHFCVFSMKNESENFDWNWIRDRCNPTYSSKQTLIHAPKMWKEFVINGKDNIQRYRRMLSGLDLVSKAEQQLKDQNDINILQNIYDFYSDKKHLFESLAMKIAYETIRENCESCTPGWTTQKSGDGGVDFIMRLNVGTDELSSVKIVVLGQAKCEKINIPTNGAAIARLVARLKRGWIGVYVTTSFFSEQVQAEIKEDKYPVLLINGKKIADIVKKELFENSMELNEYLDKIENEYPRKNLIPENIIDY